MLLRVLRRCVRFVFLSVAGCVGSADVVGSPPTLGAAVCVKGLCSTSCSLSKIMTCFRLCVALSGSFSPRASSKSAAAVIIRSLSDIVGVRQCAGYSRKVPAVRSPPVRGSKNVSRR